MLSDIEAQRTELPIFNKTLSALLLFSSHVQTRFSAHPEWLKWPSHCLYWSLFYFLLLCMVVTSSITKICTLDMYPAFPPPSMKAWNRLPNLGMGGDTVPARGVQVSTNANILSGVSGVVDELANRLVQHL